MAEYLEIEGLSKHYGSTIALDDVSFQVRGGEIHALLGENGAGKSTLMKSICGEVTPDKGTIRIDGKPVAGLTPSQARSLGITMVHQELSVFEDLPVYENIFAGEAPLWSRFSRKALRRAAEEKLKAFGLDFPVDGLVSDLSPGEKQIVEILRATAGDRRLVILDEPTSSLTASETELLIDLLHRLRDQGVSVLFVSHRISEIQAVSDRVTILRDGHVVETVENRDLDESHLVEKLVGRTLTDLYKRRDYSAAHEGSRVEFEVEMPEFAFVGETAIRVPKGHIHAVFGLDGSGASALSEAIFGLRASPGSSIRVGDVPVEALPIRLLKHGVVYLGADRKLAGLFHRLDLTGNVAAPHIGQYGPAVAVDDEPFRALSQRSIERFGIKIPGVDCPPCSLSGGNQQKVLLSVCMGVNPHILIVNEPTRGIDVGAKLEVHRALLEFAAEGGTVLLFSGELPEIIATADEVSVMRSGKYVGRLVGAGITESHAIDMAARTRGAA